MIIRFLQVGIQVRPVRVPFHHLHPFHPPLRDRRPQLMVLALADPECGLALPHGLEGLGRVSRHELLHEIRDGFLLGISQIL